MPNESKTLMPNESKTLMPNESKTLMPNESKTQKRCNFIFWPSFKKNEPPSLDSLWRQEYNGYTGGKSDQPRTIRIRGAVAMADETQVYAVNVRWVEIGTFYVRAKSAEDASEAVSDNKNDMFPTFKAVGEYDEGSLSVIGYPSPANGEEEDEHVIDITSHHCPYCDEPDIDNLVWLADGETVNCRTCGMDFRP